MKFAARLPAEPGWKAVLIKADGSLSFFEIKEWGVDYNWNKPQLIPLDMLGEDIRKKKNFIYFLDPNLKENIQELEHLGMNKAKELGWVKAS